MKNSPSISSKLLHILNIDYLITKITVVGIDSYAKIIVML